MVIRERILREFPAKGKETYLLCLHQHQQHELTNVYSFGWVNASYVVGLSMINIHMRRALGTLTPYQTFAQATKMRIEEEHDSELENDIDEISVDDVVIEE
jgi:hypothetical protein